MKPHTSFLGSTALAIISLACALPFAEASLSPLEAGRMAEPAHGAIFATAFAVLVSATFVLIAAVLVPALVHAVSGLRRIAWTCITLAAEVVFREIVKWLLVAGAASLGLLQYLEWLPHVVR
ncbi:MAG TPA: hypothetical protein VG758_05015 [Hyphomicrobiaceae bacterium]|nr:hypothetical protein [Hyphomicrobiaceae bacterium]